METEENSRRKRVERGGGGRGFREDVIGRENGKRENTEIYTRVSSLL